MKGLNFFAERADFGRFIDLYAGSGGSDGGFNQAMPLTFETVQDGARKTPFLQLTPTQAQRLMDELWHAGIRPSEGSGSAGSLAATERHLADMKTVAFHVLKIKGSRP